MGAEGAVVDAGGGDVGDAREAERLYLVQQHADVLSNGLGLLGINAPEKM